MSQVILFWQHRISLFFLFCFLVVFLPLRKKTRWTVLCLAGCYGVTGVMECVFFLYGQYELPVFLTLAEIVLIQAVPFAIGRYRDFRAMFVGFTGAVYVLAGNIACTVLCLAGASFAVNLFCQCAIHSLILGVLVWRIRDGFLESLRNEGLRWGPLCLIPALFYTAVYATAMWPANLYRNPENLLGVCSVMVLMVVSYIMIVQLFTEIKREGERKRSIEYLENYAERLKCEADLIHSYLDEGREKEIRQLLKELNEQISETTPVRYCENLAVNGIVTHCARRAKEKRVRFEVNLELPQKIQVNEFEFATVVSNLLENAVDAAAKTEDESQRFVTVSAHGVKGKLILCITNGCGEAPEISKSTGLPLSREGGQHGYGMQSVMAFVRKHEVLFDFQAKEQVFSVKMLLQV